MWQGYRAFFYDELLKEGKLVYCYNSWNETYLFDHLYLSIGMRFIKYWILKCIIKCKKGSSRYVGFCNTIKYNYRIAIKWPYCLTITLNRSLNYFYKWWFLENLPIRLVHCGSEMYTDSSLRLQNLQKYKCKEPSSNLMYRFGVRTGINRNAYW